MGDRQFGPYRLVQQIAVGGMAEIHLAKTSGIAGFEKYVALKMIHPNFSQDEQFIQMLIDEAKITVQLQHVNVAQTFDLGRVGDTYYITMEYVDGADLYKILRRASERDIATPVDVAAYIAKETATGLDYAHRKRDVTGRPLRIVHRDVSPQNVLISHAGEVKLVDFGIAKATMRVRQTAVGVIKGKYYYMSPEQAWGDPLDHRSDIFSLGIVLYEMLTGQMLYLEEDLHRLLDMVRKANIAPPTTLRRDIPPQLERIVMHALAKRPEDRYQTAGDLATDLERFLHAYSPVFTASKVTAYFDKVLAEEAAPVPVPVAPVPARDPGLNTQRVNREQLVRARAEFTDENSVIFRVNDLARNPDNWGEDMTAPDQVPDSLGAGPAATPRRPNIATMELAGDLGDEEDERTVISGPPGFGAGPEPSTHTVERASAPTVNRDGMLEPTMLERGDFDEHPTVAHGPSRVRTPPPSAPEDEGPTNVETEPLSRRGARATSSDGVPRPTIGQPRSSPGAPPALLARTREPAVSALRTPRKSRRTPPSGVPAVGPSQGSESILQAIVGSAVDSGPTAPLRGGSGVPRSVIPVDSGPPAMRTDAAPPPPPPQYHAVPAPPPQPQPPQQYPVGPPQPQPQAPGAIGFPLAAPRTPNPLMGLPIYDQPLMSAFPTGQPAVSLTKQLAALEIDEIPAHFKLGRQRSSRWLVIVAVGVAVVAVGAVIALLVRQSGEAIPARLRIDSIPTGARVTVNGTELPDRTPAFIDEVTPGKRYRIRAELEGYEPKEKEIVGASQDVDELFYLTKIQVELLVTSTPRADLFVDSVRVGTTPYSHKYSTPPEVVELRLKGFKPERRKLDWTDKTEIRLEIPLQRN